MGSWTGLEPGRAVGALDISIYKNKDGDLPGGPVAKTPWSHCRGPGFNSWSGN